MLTADELSTEVCQSVFAPPGLLVKTARKVCLDVNYFHISTPANLEEKYSDSFSKQKRVGNVKM